jgi:hypothetical protein
MPAKASLTNQLIDQLEELLIENKALEAALGVVKQFIPQAAQQRVEATLRQIKSDAKIREVVHRGLAQYRDQSLESTVEQIVKRDLKKDMN